MNEQAGCNLEIVVWKNLSEEVTLELKPEREGARNAKRGDDILSGENSLSKGPEVGKSLLFQAWRSVRLEN